LVGKSIEKEKKCGQKLSQSWVGELKGIQVVKWILTMDID
jgi:hypothetical protein